jgi:hypothetical protein
MSRFLPTLVSWLRNRPHRPAQSLARYRPRAEVLEVRCLPSTVTNLDDAGPGSLRDAIAVTPPGGTVDFQADLTGTIVLTTGELALTKDLIIAGPGADVLTVSGNHASRVFNIRNTFTVTISGMTIADGSAGVGGGINNDGALTVANCTFCGNTAHSTVANGAGGGIANGATLTVTDSALSGNAADFAGGGIWNNGGTLTITGSSLSGNSARAGGGIASGGMLILTNSNLSANSAGADGGGGGIENEGTGTVTDCTLTDNSAGTGGGAGIFNAFAARLTLTNSALSGNSAERGGGIANAGTLTVTSATLSGNSAGGGGGGGIVSLNLGTVTVTNSTLSGNQANNGPGGGISNSGGLHSWNIINTIIAGNTAPTAPDLFGNFDSQGYNLIGSSGGASGFDPSDLLDVDPLLGPLQDNGGPTQTMALLAGSPALNAGDPAQLDVPDQRGVIRSGGVNIGAYQASASAFVLAAPDTVTAGTPFDVTVQAVDPFGQVALGYTGTVTFSTSDPDPNVVLPNSVRHTSC